MNPLGLPAGSVRSVLALVLVGMLAWKGEAEAVKAAAMVVLGFYFGSRREEM